MLCVLLQTSLEPGVRIYVPAWCTFNVACVRLYLYSVWFPQALIVLLLSYFVCPFSTCCCAWHLLWTLSEPSMHTLFVFEHRCCCRHFVPLACGPKCEYASEQASWPLVSISFHRPVMWFPYAMWMHTILMLCACKHWFLKTVRVCFVCDLGPRENWILPQMGGCTHSIALYRAGSMLTLCFPRAQVMSVNVPPVGTLSRSPFTPLALLQCPVCACCLLCLQASVDLLYL